MIDMTNSDVCDSLTLTDKMGAEVEAGYVMLSTYICTYIHTKLCLSADQSEVLLLLPRAV